MPSPSPYADLDQGPKVFLLERQSDSYNTSTGVYTPGGADPSPTEINGHISEEATHFEQRRPSGRLSDGQVLFFTDTSLSEGDLLEIHHDTNDTTQGSGDFDVFRVTGYERVFSVIERYTGVQRRSYIIEKQNPED